MIFKSKFLKRFLTYTLIPTVFATICMVAMYAISVSELKRFANDTSGNLALSSWSQLEENFMQSAIVNATAITRDSASKRAIRKKQFSKLNDTLNPTFNRLNASKIIDYLYMYDGQQGQVIFSAGGDLNLDLKSLVSDIAQNNKPYSFSVYNANTEKVQIFYGFPLFIRGKVAAVAFYAKNAEPLLDNLSAINGLQYGIFANNRFVYQNFFFPSDLLNAEASDTEYEGVKYSLIKTALPLQNSEDIKLVIAKENTQSLNRLQMIEAASLIVPALLILCISTILFSVIRNISSALGLGASNMLKLAEQDFDMRGMDYRHNDEIGKILGTVSVLRDRLKKSYEIEEKERIAQRKQIENAESLQNIINGFEQNMGCFIKNMNSSADELSQGSKMLVLSATQSDEAKTEVDNASSEALGNVQSVSAASQEMSASVAEISNQVDNTLGVVRGAVDSTNNAVEQSQILSQATEDIEQIVTMIQDIAEKTNLLALNATIEAARAGDMGKGFAVVASEVKGLSNQTAEATDKIVEKISEIQNIAKIVSDSMMGIRANIEEVSTYSSTVASSIEQQSAATSEIAQSMAQASSSVIVIVEKMKNMSDSIEQVKNVSINVNISSDTLTELATGLENEVNSMRSNIDSIAD